MEAPIWTATWVRVREERGRAVEVTTVLLEPFTAINADEATGLALRIKKQRQVEGWKDYGFQVGQSAFTGPYPSSARLDTLQREGEET